VEMGYRIERIHAVPDFTCVGLPAEFCVEVGTVNPTRDKAGAVVPPPPHDTPEAMRVFQREYMPIKYGSALTSKLAKSYWERPNVAGKPLVFAIHDFHAPMSMRDGRDGVAKALVAGPARDHRPMLAGGARDGRDPRLRQPAARARRSDRVRPRARRGSGRR